MGNRDAMELEGSRHKKRHKKSQEDLLAHLRKA
jgi:hypothetical protein